MAHNPLPIPGYTPQSDEAIRLVAENKMVEELVLRQIDRHVREHGSREIDQRWVAVARTHVQEAFMALNRSVFQPGRLIGPLDVTETLKRLDRQE